MAPTELTEIEIKPSIKTTTMRTTFLSLPRELRQNILFISHELELTIPKRKRRFYSPFEPPNKTIASRRSEQSHLYVDHITEGSRYMGMLRGIGMGLKQVHSALEEDVDYVVGKWIDGVMKWLDGAEKRYQEADSELEKELKSLSLGD